VFSDEELDLVHLFILSQRVNVNAFDSQGRSPLMAAVIHNQLRLAKVLLETATCNVNAQQPATSWCKNKGSYRELTALTLAVQYNYLEMVELLLSQGKADINLSCKDMLGKPLLPLEIAFTLNHDAIAQTLLRTQKCYWTGAELHEKARTIKRFNEARRHRSPRDRRYGRNYDPDSESNYRQRSYDYGYAGKRGGRDTYHHRRLMPGAENPREENDIAIAVIISIVVAVCSATVLGLKALAGF
jgi:ankyrin repeat protein